MHFNVLTDPWIPVEDFRGFEEELGIFQTLQRAHELRVLRDASPLIEFGLYRLLITFVADAFAEAGEPMEHPLDIKRKLREGSMDAELIARYANACGSVFDLFDKDRPFLQSKSFGKERLSVAKILPQVPTSGPIHWHHSSDGSVLLDASSCARALTSISPFSTQGGRGYGTSPSGSCSYFVLPLGANLFETLMLNLPLSTGKSSASVSWRLTDTSIGRRRCKSVLEGMTWRSRRICLNPNSDGATASVEYGPGLILEGSWEDPSVAYRYYGQKELEIRKRSAKSHSMSGDLRTSEPVQAKEGRRIWRDFAPLALLRSDDSGPSKGSGETRRPAVIETASEASEVRQMLVFALRSDRANYDQWLREYLPTPVRLTNSAALGRLVENEMQRAESVASAVTAAVRQLQPRAQRKKLNELSKMFRSAAEAAERAFWERLEPSFWSLIRSLPEDTEQEGTLHRVESSIGLWRDALRHQGSYCFEEAAQDLDADGDALERATVARRKLLFRIKGTLK